VQTPFPDMMGRGRLWGDASLSIAIFDAEPPEMNIVLQLC